MFRPGLEGLIASPHSSNPRRDDSKVCGGRAVLAKTVRVFKYDYFLWQHHSLYRKFFFGDPMDAHKSTFFENLYGEKKTVRSQIARRPSIHFDRRLPAPLTYICRDMCIIDGHKTTSLRWGDS